MAIEFVGLSPSVRLLPHQKVRATVKTTLWAAGQDGALALDHAYTALESGLPNQGLGYLASAYLNEAPWKTMRAARETLKRDE